MSLTDQQETAAATFDNQVVIAIPGSGKTHTLIEQAKRMLENGAKPVISTFTKDAALEIFQRLKAATPYHYGKATVGTLHSVALLQLKLSNSPKSLLTPNQQQQFIRRAFYKYAQSKKEQSTKNLVEYIENRESGKKQPSNQKYSKAFKFYVELKDGHNALSMNDVIPYAAKVMRKSKDNYFDATNLLVDEFQDVDPTQIEWVNAFLDTDSKPMFTMYGDDDQSIYGFRNSVGYEAFREMIDNHSPKQTALDTNFRSHFEIVDLGATLIHFNSERLDKNFISSKGYGGHVHFKTLHDKERELNEIADILNSCEKPVAIIARTNFHLDEIGRHLRDAGIEYSRAFGESLFAQEEVVVYIGLLSYLINPLPAPITNALQYVGIPEYDIQRSVIHSADYGIRLKRSALDGPHSKLFRGLLSVIKDSKAEYIQNPSVACFKLASWLQENSHPSPNIDKAKVIIGEKLRGSLSSRIQFIEQSQDEDEAEVELMTCHASKGRQFPTVIIPYFNEGTFPLIRAGEVADVDEERRLLYVTITRAMQHLYFTRHEVCERGSAHSPSSFAKEMALV